MVDLADKYLKKKYGQIYSPEVQEGEKLRAEYADSAGLTSEDMDTLDSHADYVPQYYLNKEGGQMNDVAPVQETPKATKFMNLPVYKALLNRGPSSESQPIVDDSEKGRISDEEAAAAATPNRQQRNAANVNSDLMVGASHALLGLLSGNANRASMEYGKANQYVAGQKKQDLENLSKMVKTVGPEGKPIFTPTVEAADMQAYEAPKGGVGGGAAGSFQLAQMYDPDSNRYFTVRHNSRTGEMLDMAGAPITPPANAIVRPVAPKLFTTEDVQGTKTEQEYNPYKGQKTAPLVKTGGLGAHYGVATKGQGEAIEKGLGKGQEEYQGLSGSLVDIKQAKQSLNNTKDPRVLAESVYSMVRSVESKGVLTDQDFENITGMKYMSWYKNMDNLLKTKAYGEVEELRNSFKGLANKIESKIQNRLESIPSRYAPQTKRGKEALKAVVPEIKIDRSKQADLLKYDRAASAKWGKGSDKYNKFMAAKKAEIGI